MEYRFLGSTGIKVSALSFGTMSFGGDADEATSARLYAMCRDAGINLFDCANVYNRGRSEALLGKLAASDRQQLVLTSKACFPTGEDVNARGSSRYHLVRAVEESLGRLGTDYIDLYFLHRFDEATDLEESLRALDTLVTQGKILYPALSNFAAWQAQKALGVSALEKLARPVCVQPMYNLVKRQAEVEILPMARAEQIGVLAYSPLGGGLLTGKYSDAQPPGQGRLVDNPMYADRYAGAQGREVARQLGALARAQGHHPATLAVAWVASHPAVSSALLGARSPEQLEACLAAAPLCAQWREEPTLRGKVSALAHAPPPATDRSEESGAHDMWKR